MSDDPMRKIYGAPRDGAIFVKPDDDKLYADATDLHRMLSVVEKTMSVSEGISAALSMMLAATRHLCERMGIDGAAEYLADLREQMIAAARENAEQAQAQAAVQERNTGGHSLN